jgi:hypothetical protein
VKRLDQRYLWVDVLCLIQDDKSDMEKGINSMDSIYEGAVFTIVAANGSDANAGLPGVRDRKLSQVIETIWRGVRMTVIHSVDDIIKNSKYGSRGWT